jgi:pilus assembly protein CpaB
VELTKKTRYRRESGLRKLLSTRKGTAIVAGVATVVAAAILLIAATQYRKSVVASGNPVTVFVASSLIQKGTAGDEIASQHLFNAEQLSAKQVSAGALADTSALTGKVAATDIQPGEQLTAADFTSSGGIMSTLAPNQRAISIPLDTSHGLTGVLSAGDRVDVYAGVDSSVDRGVGGANVGAALRLLIPDVPVLEVNQNGSNNSLSGNGVNTEADVVLKVSSSDAGALAFASDNGKVWLVLRGPNALTSKATQTEYTVNSLLLGSKPAGTGGKP